MLMTMQPFMLSAEAVIWSLSKHEIPRVMTISNLENPISVTNLDDNSLLLMGEHGLAVYDKQKKMIVASRELNFRLTATSRYNNLPILFDDQGRQHLVKGINELVTTNVPVTGRVTAFASSKASKKQVFGMSDGTIYLYDEGDQKVTKLERPPLAHLQTEVE